MLEARGAFVGRQSELDQLLAGLADAFAGRGRLFLVAGEPGIGKSRLAAEECPPRARARRPDARRPLLGGGRGSRVLALGSVAARLRECARALVLKAQLGDGAAELAQILPELRELLPGLPEPASVDSEGARFRLFDATARFLHNASESRPIVLVLDDLHAADTPSLLLLQFVARELSDSRILIVGAFRDVDPVPAPALTAMLAEVAREPVTSRMTLRGVTEEDVARISS